MFSGSLAFNQSQHNFSQRDNSNYPKRIKIENEGELVNLYSCKYLKIFLAKFCLSYFKFQVRMPVEEIESNLEFIIRMHKSYNVLTCT